MDCDDPDCVSPSVLEKPTGIKHVVIIDIDGLRPDKFEEELKAGHLPTFAEILGTTNYCNPQDDPNSHCIVVKDARTGFPSLTLPGHASIFTGCYINKHGIYANNWLDRTSDEGKEGEGYHYLQAVVAFGDFGLANSHLKADTIYEAGAKASRDFTAVVGFNYYIGNSYFLANEKNCLEACEKVKACEEMSDKKNKKKCKNECKAICKEATKIWKAWYKNQLKWIQPCSADKILFGVSGETNGFDESMMLKVLAYLQDRINDKKGFPDIVTLYFAAVDHEGHVKGTDSQDENLVVIDNQLKWLIDGTPFSYKPSCGFKNSKFKGLKEIPSESGTGTLFDDTVFVICADHGHSDVSKDEIHSICYEDLEDAIKLVDPAYVVTKIVPTEAEKKLKTEERLFYDKELPRLVLALNDGMAHIYVKKKGSGEKEWDKLPDLCPDVMPVARLLKKTDGELDPSKPYKLGPYILKRNGVSMILIKDRDAGRYKVFNGGNGCTSPLEELTEYFTDDEAFRINMLYNGVYSGDIVILANYDDSAQSEGYYLSDSDWVYAYKYLLSGDPNCPNPFGADHGNICSSDLEIPFIIAGKPLEGKSASVPKAEQVDIAPTVADILGFEMPGADGKSIFPPE